MARRDGPTTIGPVFLEPSLIRSGRKMNADANEQKAARQLRKLIISDVDKGPEIRRLLKSGLPAHDVAKKFGLH